MPTLVFWIDVDNTLLANDEVKQRIDEGLRIEIGDAQTNRFWEIYEQVRKERGVVDIPLALARFREETPLTALDEHTYLQIHSLFDNFPFPSALYPHVKETLAYLRTVGVTVIVSDGDLDFQAEKIFRSSLAEAVDGRVLLFTHKQQNLQELMHAYPADHYGMIDDKPDILWDTKKLLGDRVTTIFVRQGKYAHGPLPEGFYADQTVEHFGDLRSFEPEQFFFIRK
ncbi:MAG TPA: hypothetical protein VKX46_02905 [Ktedonobacteraceae bacterium]|nr:hypothetical protein [Ktedonobacteraceae bacterium]